MKLLPVPPSAPPSCRVRIGKVYFDEGKLVFFLGYHECPSCRAYSKVVVSVDDARTFSKQIGEYRDPLGMRLMKMLMKKYELP